jgi:hypothetical protein
MSNIKSNDRAVHIKPYSIIFTLIAIQTFKTIFEIKILIKFAYFFRIFAGVINILKVFLIKIRRNSL